MIYLSYVKLYRKQKFEFFIMHIRLLVNIEVIYLKKNFWFKYLHIKNHAANYNP